MYIRKLIYITVPNQGPLFITKNYYHRIEITLVACMMLLEAKTTYFLSFFVSWFNTFRYCDF